MSTRVDRADAAAALLERRRARKSLLAFTCYMTPRYKVDPVHRLIASTLDQVVEGKIKRLIISVPPQHGKSTLASEHLPAHWLGQRPNDPVVMASYAAPLIEGKSRLARNMVQSRLYSTLYGEMATREVEPVLASSNSRAVDEWRLAPPYAGGLRAAGIGGGLTGYPAVLGIIDDPFQGPEDAYSFAKRQRVWDWYTQVMFPRIAERGSVVIVMTRWHEDDLVGRLLKAEGDQWMLLRLAAVAETQEERDYNNLKLGLRKGLPDPLGRKPGEPVAPSLFSYQALMERKKLAGNAWHALYQGVPRSPEGGMFKREWLMGKGRVVKAAPREAFRIRYWDKAGTQGGGAYTAGVLLAFHAGIVYVEHVVRGQWSAGEREAVMKQTAKRDANLYGGAWVVTIYIEQEPGSGGKESADNTVRNLAGYNIKVDRPTGSKDVRIQPFAAQAEAGNVRLVDDVSDVTKWNYDYIEELVGLPQGQYRDQSDATSGGYNRGIEIVSQTTFFDVW